MRLSLLKAAPALVAMLLLAVLPSCASNSGNLLHTAALHAREESRPVINHRLKPVVEGAPTCIQRGASMEFDPPAPDGELWVLAIFYLLIYIGYGIGWCFVALGELIYEACDAPETEEEEPLEGSPPQQP